MLSVQRTLAHIHTHAGVFTGGIITFLGNLLTSAINRYPIPTYYMFMIPIRHARSRDYFIVEFLWAVILVSISIDVRTAARQCRYSRTGCNVRLLHRGSKIRYLKLYKTSLEANINIPDRRYSNCHGNPRPNTPPLPQLTVFVHH